ncbi:GHMP family kinase ATP-binding protein [Blattabacterium cuenoti]|uniref:GHMP family kinase ATP-binding protein n=1 Tax=Blattabacterium cuenoti TaxID=1653831 RepID=UPI001EEC8F7D|nr:mevalonate kinase [Blattabacterium cuenoti]
MFKKKPLYDRDLIAKNSNKEIKKYCRFMMSKKLLYKKLNLSKLIKDLNNGIFFNSNIPQKYGLGSSGALISSIYNKYSENNKLLVKKKNLIHLKKIFSIMESFFHGKSSGIDPLVCYIKKPILVKSINKLSIINNKNILLNFKKFKIFIIDSEITSGTKLMYKFFFNKLKEKKFKKIMKEEFTMYNKTCIKYFLKGEEDKLMENIKKISNWTFYNLTPMITKNIKNIWKNGIKNNNYYLKLCGSGGGGFYIGFTKNYDLIKNLKKINKIIL